MAQRETKFRAWLPDGHWAIKSEGKQMIDDYASTLLFESLAGFSDDALVFMQFIGINADDGTPIYEGDIIQYDTENGPFIAQVIHEFSDGEERWISGFTTKVIKSFEYDGDNAVPLAVLGNIHENPELLQPQ